MSAAAARVRPSAVNISSRAALRIADLLSAKGKAYLRLGVKTRGCNGMSYTLNYADGPNSKFEEVVEAVAPDARPVKVLVEPSALMHVVGSTMDWVEDALRAEFVFQNPNSKGECGCGESFTTKDASGPLPGSGGGGGGGGGLGQFKAR